MTGDQTFAKSCVGNFRGGSIPYASVFGENLITIHYELARNLYGLFEEGYPSSYVGPGDVNPNPDPDPNSAGTEKAYLKVDSNHRYEFIIRRASPGGVPLDYVRYATYTHGFLDRGVITGSNRYDCVFGVPTPGGNTLTDSITYTRTGIAGGLTQTAYKKAGGPTVKYTLERSVLTVSVDATNDKINVTVRLIGTVASGGSNPVGSSVDFGTFSGVGKIDRTKPSFGGTLLRTDGRMAAATFGGWFFGPGGREVGLVFSTAHRDNAFNQLVSQGVGQAVK